MIYDVTWIGTDPGQPVRSQGDLLSLVRRGAARLVATNTVLNLPVVPAGSALEHDPESRPLRSGWYDGTPVNYFDFGPARPSVMIASAGCGERASTSSVPGRPGYSDLWGMGNRVRNCPVVYVEGRPATRTLIAQREPRPPARAPVASAREVARAAAPPPAAAPVSPASASTTTAPVPAQAAAAPTTSATGALVYSGFARQIAVRPPRIERDIEVNGSLADSAWSQAAVLTGFSQFQPLDGIPADDSTEVLVWYSPHAIYFGIRAYEAHGAVHATLADRDKIGSDDYVQILLDTFDDHRRALVFSANPFGVQSDGNLTEGLQAKGSGGLLGPSTASVRDTADLSADYSYQSKGHLVDYGYEVVIRVPFKSIRYQSVAEQNWGLNVVRRVQHSGREHSWTPARRANASFLSQSGTLLGLHGLQRGLVMDLNPVVTSKVSGTPSTTALGWSYDASRPQFGGNVRWGITNNLNLNGTVKPDFSQVEADVQQVVFEPRAALFYPEKRPFFLDGIETFESPTPLIYTRQVVQPVAAAKLTGKVGGATVGFLSAVDDKSVSASGTENPVYNMLRVKRDLGAQSTGGFIYTDKIDGSDFNRVAALDTRIVFGKVYSFTAQGAGSMTRSGGVTRSGQWSGPSSIAPAANSRSATPSAR